MKKILIIFALLAFTGCTSTNRIDWSIYEDPSDRFAFNYPSSWIQTHGHSETQFWNSMEEDEQTVKIILFEEPRDWEDLQEYSDDLTEIDEVFSIEDVDGNQAIKRVATNSMGYSETYYYQLKLEVVGIAALFKEDDSETQELVHILHQSFQETE